MALLIAEAGPLFSLTAEDLLPVLKRFSLVATVIVKEERFDKGLERSCSADAERMAAFRIRHAASLPASRALLSTAAFLLNLEKAGIIQSAARARQAIATGRPDASLVVVEREWGGR